MSQNAGNIIHRDYSRPYRRVLSASTLAKDSVRNRTDEDVGSIKEIMGRCAFRASRLRGIVGWRLSRNGRPLFAIPWEALYDPTNSSPPVAPYA
jgi:hypothetical protein